MRTKGISIWEQHLERIVVAAAILALLVFAAMQFLGDPNAVEIAGKGKVGPGEIDKSLEEKASSIAEKIRSAPLDLPPPEPLAEKFELARTAGISPQPNLPQVAFAVSPNPIGSIDDKNRLFVIPNIPAPRELVTKQYFDTLSAETVEEHPDLKKSLPAAAPYDVTWVTAAATFDAGSVRRQFGQPGPNGEFPLPQLWFNNRVDFIDVKIEREELEQGKWVKSTLLEPIPGQVTVRPSLGSAIDASIRSEILWTVSPEQGRDSLIQPEFYAGAAAAWEPPGKEESGAFKNEVIGEDNALRDLKDKLARAVKNRDRITAKMKELRCPAEAPPPPPKGGTGTGGKGSGRGGGGDAMGGGGRSLQEKPSEAANEAECKKLRPQLHRVNQQIAELEAAIAKAAPAEPPAPVEPEQPQEEESPDEILVWGHDINVLPGKTYRYRFTIEIYNPLFARKLELTPAQQQMAEQFTLASQVSEWSAPVSVNPPLRFFVTSAKAPSQITTGIGPRLGSATIEVYRFRDGRWWMNQFNNVQPGDRLGAVRSNQAAGKQNVDYSTDWFVLDVVPDTASQDGDLGRAWAASVLLQSLSDQSVSHARHPRQDFTDPERAYLRQEVKSAEAGGAVASR